MVCFFITTPLALESNDIYYNYYSIVLHTRCLFKIELIYEAKLPKGKSLWTTTRTFFLEEKPIVEIVTNTHDFKALLFFSAFDYIFKSEREAIKATLRSHTSHLLRNQTTVDPRGFYTYIIMAIHCRLLAVSTLLYVYAYIYVLRCRIQTTIKVSCRVLGFFFFSLSILLHFFCFLFLFL